MPKWLDYNYDFDDPPKQKRGPDNRDLIEAQKASANKRQDRWEKKLKAALEADMAAEAAKAAERAKGTLELCRVCKSFSEHRWKENRFVRLVKLPTNS